MDGDALFRKIHEVIIKTCIAVEPHIVSRLSRGAKWRGLCFETYGFDILIDSGLRPWLLEVNVCPSLSSSSPLDKRIKTSLMCDIFNMVGVVPFDRKVVGKDGGGSTGKGRHRAVAELAECRDLTEYPMTEDDWKILLETDEESSRSGHFERIFPLRRNVDYFEQFFESPRYNNLLVWKYLKGDESLLKKRFRREAVCDPV